MATFPSTTVTLTRIPDGVEWCAPRIVSRVDLVTSFCNTFKGWRNVIAFCRVMIKWLYKSGLNIGNTKIQVCATPGLAQSLLRIPKHA